MAVSIFWINPRTSVEPAGMLLEHELTGKLCLCTCSNKQEAALHELSTKRRLRVVMVPIEEGGKEFHPKDLKKLNRHEREAIVAQAMETRDQENEILLTKILERLRK